MTRPLRAATLLLALFGFAGAASEASAQCPPHARFCAQASVGGGVVIPVNRGAQVVITIGPPPPPVVVVRPPPPPPPPPRIIYVAPQPPPPPPPQVVYVRPQPQPQQVVYAQQPAQVSRRNVRGTSGLHFFVAGAGGQAARLGGVGGAIRFRPRERFGIDLGVGVFGGDDYYGRGRAEIPITAEAPASAAIGAASP